MQLENRYTQQTNRPYIVHFHDNMGAGPYPLVLVQHGGGTSPELFSESTGKSDINEVGNTNDFIMVITQENELPSSPGSKTWNAGFSAKGISNADDIKEIVIRLSL